MEALPVGDTSCDAVFSQYAIEYANLAQSLAEARRVLKPGGLLSILALPAQSSFVLRADLAVKQARPLLSSSLFERATKVIREYHQTADNPEITRNNLIQFSQEVERFTLRFDANTFEVVSAAVTRLNDIFIERTKQDLDTQLNEINAFRTRLAHYAARCQATVKAGVGDRRYETFKTSLTDLGFTIVDTRSVFIGGHGVVATQISAVRGMDAS